MPLVDLKDLRSLMTSISERSKEIGAKYGNVAATSVGSIQRRFLVLEEQGANQFFGEPALDIMDFIRVAPDGRGVISVLAADRLMEKPRLYATFLLWMLSKLWMTLPEVGDQPKPKLVFFFDEAHLCSTTLRRRYWSALNRSRASSDRRASALYFITQNPWTCPTACRRSSAIACSMRYAHSHRRKQKAVKAAATTFRKNPDLDTEKV